MLQKVLLSQPPIAAELAIVLLRVFIGICLVVHGLGKLGVVGTGSMQGFVGWLRSLGVPFPEVQARLAMLSELLGGVLITVGLLTRPALLVCCFTLLVAAKVGHKGAGYLITNSPPGAEYALNLAVVLAAMALLGPGAYSLDALIFAP